MTGRRKARKSGSSKKESPDKTRRSTRKRGQKKSESEDDSGSEKSVDGRVEDEMPKKDSDVGKEDESGGSDGAWQVRSENGNKGGIPKLKISLHRPSETSSPTPEPLSSPKPRRSRRGAANEEVCEDGSDSVSAKETVSETSENEGDRRSSRSKRQKDKQDDSPQDNDVKDSKCSEDLKAEDESKNLDTAAGHKTEDVKIEEQRKNDEEGIQAKKQKYEQAKKKLEEDIAKNKREEEERTKKKKDDEESARKKKEDDKLARRKKEEEEIAKKKKEEDEVAKKKKEEEEIVRKKKEEEEITKKKKEEEIVKKKKEEEEKAAMENANKEKEARRKSLEDKERAHKEKEARRKSLEEKEKQARRSLEEKEIDAQRKLQEEKVVKDNSLDEDDTRGESNKQKHRHTSPADRSVESEVDKVAEKVSEDKLADKGKLARNRRSVSRDSSEERAKQAALASRKRKKRSGSEDGEVFDSPEREVSFPVRTEGKIRTSVTTAGNSSNDNKEAPVRKRRWGSSSNNKEVKKPLLISTDVLKEIIPEVKPVALSEVELSPNKDEILLDDAKPAEAHNRSEDNARLGSRRRRSVPSDESEKDYEEEGVDSDGEEMVKKAPPAVNHLRVDDEINEKEKDEPSASATRKVLPPDPLESLTKQRSPSPAKHPPSNVLYITNLVRPFTVVQLRDLLARTGTIADEKGFWIDSIKSRCYVKYTAEEDAKNTRHALHGVRWPASNPKQLNVDFGTESAMTNALEGGRPAVVDANRQALVRDRDRERDVEDKGRRREKDERKSELTKTLSGKENDGREVRRVMDRDREREKSRERDRDRSREDKPSRTVRKVTLPVREWDMGKAERGFSPPPEDTRRFSDSGRKRDKERNRSPSYEPERKTKRKDDPPKLLQDDLFNKTKATPWVYWLPLSDQQIAEKETQRRKHMAEHEKRIAEERKRREAKRRKTRSRSPKK